MKIKLKREFAGEYSGTVVADLYRTERGWDCVVLKSIKKKVPLKVTVYHNGRTGYNKLWNIELEAPDGPLDTIDMVRTYSDAKSILQRIAKLGMVNSYFGGYTAVESQEEIDEILSLPKYEG
jgi:hypothetical protein